MFQRKINQNFRKKRYLKLQQKGRSSLSEAERHCDIRDHKKGVKCPSSGHCESVTVKIMGNKRVVGGRATNSSLLHFRTSSFPEISAAYLGASQISVTKFFADKVNSLVPSDH